MRKEKRFYYFLIVGCVTVFLFSFESVGITEKNTKIKFADTTSFTPNTTEGWNILSSYLNQETPDSVEFELILLQNNSINWSAEQFIGKITNQTFIPRKIQKLTYDLFINNTWSVRVNTNGQCFLKQVNGATLGVSSLSGSPYVFPVKVRFKNN